MQQIEKIAVLLTCHNRKEITINCLESLFNASLPFNYSMKVFLVDDNSTDGTSVSITEKYPEVNLIEGSGLLFWNRGMHLAWENASTKNDFDFYVWLNDDVILFKNAFLDLPINSNQSRNSIICGITKSKNENRISYGGSNVNGELIEPNGTNQACEVFNGNFVLIPKKVFFLLGNLDRKFIHAIGDYDYALRAKKKGIKVYVSEKFIGLCENHRKPPLWCQPEVNFNKRIQNLYSPLGNSHPYYYFIFEKRHYGLLVAIKHYVSIHIRLLLPTLWKRK